MAAVGEAPEANNAGRDVERVTISEAATLLNVHPNTVRNRVKAEIYRAEKVVTERGPTWMIDRDSLITNTPPNTSQQTPSQRKPNLELQPTELVQELLRPFVEDLGRVREELGAERVRREQAERERDQLAAQLEALREPRESPETVSEVDTGDVTPEPVDPVERPSWWRRFFGLE